MVDWGELGFGGKGTTLEASLVDLAATTTAGCQLMSRLRDGSAALTRVSILSEIDGDLASDAS